MVHSPVFNDRERAPCRPEFCEVNECRGMARLRFLRLRQSRVISTDHGHGLDVAIAAGLENRDAALVESWPSLVTYMLFAESNAMPRTVRPLRPVLEPLIVTVGSTSPLLPAE